MNNNKYIFIATHNGRMKCILSEILKKKNNNQKLLPSEIKGFNNCSVLSLKFTKIDNYLSINNINNIKLLNNTSYSENKEKVKYFTNNEFSSFISKHKINEDFIYNLNQGIFSNCNKKLEELTVLLIRHGQGVHNVGKIEKISEDPKLTDIGVEQAYDCGTNLVNELKINSNTEITLYSSILYRTIQTLSIVMLSIYNLLLNNLNKQKIINKFLEKPIIMLPFNHEYAKDKLDSNCKNKYKQNLFNLGKENVSSFYNYYKYSKSSVTKFLKKNKYSQMNYGIKFYFPVIKYKREKTSKKNKNYLEGYYLLRNPIKYKTDDFFGNNKEYMNPVLKAINYYLCKKSYSQIDVKHFVNNDTSIYKNLINNNNDNDYNSLNKLLNKLLNTQSGGELKKIIEKIKKNNLENRFINSLKHESNLLKLFIEKLNKY